MECYTCDDIVESLRGCRLGIDPDSKCVDELDSETDLKEAVREAMAFLKGTFPDTFSETKKIITTEEACFFEFDDFETITDVISVDGVKAKEEEAEDENNGFDCLKSCLVYNCPDIECDGDEPLFTKNMKANTLSFKDPIPVGSEIILCGVPCEQECLPKGYTPNGQYYSLIKWMSISLVLCSVVNDKDTLEVADRYYKKVYDFIRMKFEIEHDRVEESIRFLRQTRA